MNTCERLAAYTVQSSWDAISPEARGKLKQHVLDTIGCALGAIPAQPIAAIRSEEADANPQGKCSLIGGGYSTPERAALTAAIMRSEPMAMMRLTSESGTINGPNSPRPYASMA